MDDKLKIELKIIGAKYPMIINKYGNEEEEELYRKAAKLVNETKLKYDKAYDNLTNQDQFGLTAFNFAYKALVAERAADEKPFIDEIRSLNDELKAFIEDN